MSDNSFDFAFERPAFRRGKLRKGVVSSKRRHGEHRCMGACFMCSAGGGRNSLSHMRNKRNRVKSLDLDWQPNSGSAIVFDKNNGFKSVKAQARTCGRYW